MTAARTQAILKLAQAKDKAVGYRRTILKKLVIALCYGQSAAKARRDYLKATRH